MRCAAEELEISVSKVVKLLISAGEYTSDMSERVMKLTEAGKSVADIQGELGISRAVVHYYLPYKKGIYKAKETCLNADRIKRYRMRSVTVEVLQKSGDLYDLWKCVDRKETSKSITRS